MTTIDIPAGPSELTAEWLTYALHAGGAVRDARVASFETENVGEGSGFIGQLARVALQYEGDAPDAPRSLIAKFPGASEGGRAIGMMFRFYEREIRFYDDVGQRIAMRIPRRYHSEMDLTQARFALLLEDLAPSRCGDQLAGCSYDDARAAVTELAKFHAAWWQHPDLTGRLDWMPMVNDPVQQLAQAAYAQAWQPFVDNFGKRLSAEMLSIAERVGQNVIEFQNRIADEPRTIMHGDYRADNMFFRSPAGGADFAVVDWQIASRGRGIFDVTYFVCGALPKEMRRQHEMDLLHLYHDTLQAGGVRDYPWDQCVREYRMMALYYMVYVVISLGTLDFANERGLALFNTLLERSTTAVAELEAAELF